MEFAANVEFENEKTVELQLLARQAAFECWTALKKLEALSADEKKQKKAKNKMSKPKTD